MEHIPNCAYPMISTNCRGTYSAASPRTVIALPVGLGFGVASGLGPIAGIYSAIAVGFFAAVFGGTPSQISGPTGPMTIAMAVVLTQHADGDPVKAFTIVMLAGFIQIALGLLRIGSFVTYTPYSVISGFMSGIGVIVMTIQILAAAGSRQRAGRADELDTGVAGRNHRAQLARASPWAS